MSDTPPESGGGGPKMPAALSKKYGSFSLGVWLLILTGGVVAGLLIRKVTAGFGQAPAADLPTTVPTDQFTSEGVGGSTVPINGGPAGTGQNMPADATTNDMWQSRALTFLIGRGFDSAEADTALRKYLYGDAVTAKEAAMVSVALTYMGAPPEAVEPMQISTSPVTPVPVPTPQPPPPPPTSAPVTPAAAQPALSPDALAWIGSAADLAQRVNAMAAGGQKVSDADLHKLAGMGFTSHDPALSQTARFYYRIWLDQNGYKGQLA